MNRIKLLPTKGKTYYEFVNILRIFAMLLVFNSHCDALYRHPWLATGGAIGNALFFIISGYFISAKSQNGNSLKWIFNKIIRLYLPTLLAIIISMLVSGSYPPLSLPISLPGLFGLHRFGSLEL